MFSLFKKKPQGELLTLKISGMHCTSCSLSIDGELEDTPGVITSNTSYAKSVTKVEVMPGEVSREQLVKVIESLGYQVAS